MSRYIVKLRPETDLYVEWSTGVDSPLVLDTREGIINSLVPGWERREHYREDDPDLYAHIMAMGVEMQERMVRADECGTTAYGRSGTWEDTGFIVREIGAHQWWLTRAQVVEWLEAVWAAPGDGDEVWLEALEAVTVAHALEPI